MGTVISAIVHLAQKSSRGAVSVGVSCTVQIHSFLEFAVLISLLGGKKRFILQFFADGVCGKSHGLPGRSGSSQAALQIFILLQMFYQFLNIAVIFQKKLFLTNKPHFQLRVKLHITFEKQRNALDCFFFCKIQLVPAVYRICKIRKRQAEEAFRWAQTAEGHSLVASMP